MTTTLIWRSTITALLLALALGTALGVGRQATTRAAETHRATPSAFSCDEATPMAGMAMGTPMAGMAEGGMAMGSPTAGMAMEIDQIFIDSMIPHHASIVAMAQAALPRLADERLRAIAQTIVDTQSAEIGELRGYRAAFYGDPEPAPMDEHMMGAMMQMMPNLTMPMDAMMAQMDAATQVELLCAAADTDRAFIDLTIPHHESAIAMAEATVGQATHEEIRAFAERVIADQQREIGELSAIRAELYGSATPEAVGP